MTDDLGLITVIATAVALAFMTPMPGHAAPLVQAGNTQLSIFSGGVHGATPLPTLPTKAATPLPTPPSLVGNPPGAQSAILPAGFPAAQ